MFGDLAASIQLHLTTDLWPLALLLSRWHHRHPAPVADPASSTDSMQLASRRRVRHTAVRLIRRAQWTRNSRAFPGDADAEAFTAACLARRRGISCRSLRVSRGSPQSSCSLELTPIQTYRFSFSLLLPASSRAMRSDSPASPDRLSLRTHLSSVDLLRTSASSDQCGRLSQLRRARRR
jgi:hypothetical protein